MISGYENTIYDGVDPNTNYRLIGRPAVDDFLKTGVIRGTSDFFDEAYFVRGGLWDADRMPDYRVSVRPSAFENNPLYHGWREDTAQNIRVLRPLNSGIMTDPVEIAYARQQGAPLRSFLNTINPANRSGIMLDNRFTGELFYDRLTPFFERPMSTHAKNIGVESKIVGGAIKDASINASRAAVDKMSQVVDDAKWAIKRNPMAAAGTALGVTGVGLTVLDMYNRAGESSAQYRSSREAELGKGEGEPFSYTQEFLKEVGARLPGFAEASANAATFGGYDFGKAYGGLMIDLANRAYEQQDKAMKAQMKAEGRDKPRKRFY